MRRPRVSGPRAKRWSPAQVCSQNFSKFQSLTFEPLPGGKWAANQPTSAGAAMSEHRATISWKRTSEEFLKGKYSREHTWTFDGGAIVRASSSPSVVPVPYSNPANVDPEEAYVASLSSCHMLTFLYLAGRRGFQIDSYDDEAIGVITKNERKIPWVSTVTLNPRIVYGGDKRPTPAEEEQLHHQSHEQCFIANSVKTEVIVKPSTGPV
jgi:organic hydroperoxide reductase OsmC/OhrA